jgi:TPR repeat protein
MRKRLNTRAADRGDPKAQFNLASMYETGKGVSQNYEKAIELYTKAADQGLVDAQYNLALMYENGDGKKLR